MKDAFDSSIIVAALVPNENFHGECRQFVTAGGHIYQHGLVEVFNTLTGGRKPYQFRASLVASMLVGKIEETLAVTQLLPSETNGAFGEAESRGVRGGAIFDYLHLVAARKVGADRLVTLNLRHFQSFWRPGDPIVVHPGEA
ncbi:MAG: hypothetical protein AAGC74_07145 [Verrucomicrobiota bacterium]